MEKSKTELYLERLRKWREEKQKNQDGPPAKKARTSTKTGTVTGRQSTACAIVQPRPQAQNKGTKLIRADKSKSTTAEKSKPKVQGEHNNGKTMSQKLDEWKKAKAQKGKEWASSAGKKNASSAQVVSGKSRTQFREVKSRLFDFQNKPRPSLASRRLSVAKGKENTGKKCTTINEPKNTAQINQSSKPAQRSGLPRKLFVKKTNQSNSVSKHTAAIQRRHSVAHHAVPKPPTSILKRKSCIGSLDTVEGNARNETTVEKASQLDAGKVVHDGGCMSHQFPTTPGTASRNVRFVSPEVSLHEGRSIRKTPKTPASRRAQLNEWLKAKGKTPSKFRHLVCFNANNEKQKLEDPHTKSALTVEELSEQMNVIEEEKQDAEAEKLMISMLGECSTLIDADCPSETLLPILDSIYSQIPCAQTSALFYQCKARVLRSSLDLDAILQVFAQATINNAQPKEALAQCLTETIKYVSEEQVRRAKAESKAQRRSHVEPENIFASSAVVYSVSNVTPLSESKKSRRRTDTPTPACRVLTPVRRSTRRSLQNLPSSLRDNSERFYSLQEVDESERDNMLFRPNRALSGLLGDGGDEQS